MRSTGRGIGPAAWRRPVPFLLASFAISVVSAACATPQSGSRAGMGVASIFSVAGHQQGTVGPISWWAGDMHVVTQENAYGAFDTYFFTLILKDTQGVPVTFTRMEWNVTDQDIILSGPSVQAGSWPIAAHGERRFTWPYSTVCPMLYTCAPTEVAEPRWTFSFTGATALGERVDVPIAVSLPPQTLRTRFQW